MATFFLTERGISRLESLLDRASKGQDLSQVQHGEMLILASLIDGNVEFFPEGYGSPEFLDLLGTLLRRGYIRGVQSPHIARGGEPIRGKDMDYLYPPESGPEDPPSTNGYGGR